MDMQEAIVVEDALGGDSTAVEDAGVSTAIAATTATSAVVVVAVDISSVMDPSHDILKAVLITGIAISRVRAADPSPDPPRGRERGRAPGLELARGLHDPCRAPDRVQDPVRAHGLPVAIVVRSTIVTIVIVTVADGTAVRVLVEEVEVVV